MSPSCVVVTTTSMASAPESVDEDDDPHPAMRARAARTAGKAVRRRDII
jgi:hypothetical protein